MYLFDKHNSVKIVGWKARRVWYKYWSFSVPVKYILYTNFAVLFVSLLWSRKYLRKFKEFLNIYELLYYIFGFIPLLNYSGYKNKSVKFINILIDEGFRLKYYNIAIILQFLVI